MKFIGALSIFGFASALAVISFFYLPPEVAQLKMINAVQGEEVWWMSIDDSTPESNLHLDFVRRREKENLVRVSFPSIKIINNQWIALGKGEDLFATFKLKNRRTTFRELFSDRQEQYEFEIGRGFPGEIAAFIKNSGLIWLDSGTFLPTRIELGELQAQITYADPLSQEAGTPRSLEEVLAQLQELLEARNGKPKKLIPLTQGGGSTAAFATDFDHDGLSDALEIFYGTDPANPDSDDDTFMDGEEVRRRYNPLGEGALN